MVEEPKPIVMLTEPVTKKASNGKVANNTKDVSSSSEEESSDEKLLLPRNLL